MNTIVREDDGTLTGTNTDAPGFLEPLRATLDKTHLFRMARVLGTGGAARAITGANWNGWKFFGFTPRPRISK